MRRLLMAIKPSNPKSRIYWPLCGAKLPPSVKATVGEVFSNGQAANVDAFRKSVINAVTYAGKVAGDAAGCAFNMTKKPRRIASRTKAAGEKAQQTAAGKDANSTEQVGGASMPPKRRRYGRG